MALESKPKSTAKSPRKRFIGTKSAIPSRKGVSHIISNQIPVEILQDEELNEAIKQLPSNYSFEIHKTIHHVRKNNVTMVALQMPEGLQMFACTIADIVERFTPALTTIMGDVTYGACCVDDYTAIALGCDMLIHYAHSCLVPMDQTSIKTLYIFVEIGIDSVHVAQTIRLNFPSDREIFYQALLENEEENKFIPAGEYIPGPSQIQHLRIEAGEGTTTGHDTTVEKHNNIPTRLALVSTIQFVSALQSLKENLSEELPQLPSGSDVKIWTGKYDTVIPRAKPLSPGELLGCTAPRLPNDVDALIYLGDGRFHLESVMIANPRVPAFRYDPYSKKLTRERYDHLEMQTIRYDAVVKARKSIHSEQPLWGMILGTLGRQGNFNHLNALSSLLTQNTGVEPVSILLSELSPAKLAMMSPHISTFVQTSCPRLSIDWGYAFKRPLLSPYECKIAVEGEVVPWRPERDHNDNEDVVYPMDFYTAASPWAVSRTKGSF